MILVCRYILAILAQKIILNQCPDKALKTDSEFVTLNPNMIIHVGPQVNHAVSILVPC